jgi:2-polyprenyl-3-methyl-5-hydroxy-6-metoxy-1,4-benzoquinol methylase
MPDSSTQQMIQVNVEQASFYDRVYADGKVATQAGAAIASERGNFGSKVWCAVKRRGSRMKAAAGGADTHDRLIRKWIGSAENKKVLDLGPGRGHVYSIDLATQARDYLAIDLSATGVAVLGQRLKERGLTHARAIAGDVLAPEFTDRGFDIVHARSVLHHFADPQALAQRLFEVTAPGGMVVSVDPLNAGLAVRTARAMLRPFQTDAAWEWPITPKTLEIFERYFELEQVQGITGRAKWAIPLSLFSANASARFYRVFAEWDRLHACKKGPALWSCIHIVMLLRRREHPLKVDR